MQSFFSILDCHSQPCLSDCAARGEEPEPEDVVTAPQAAERAGIGGQSSPRASAPLASRPSVARAETLPVTWAP